MASRKRGRSKSTPTVVELSKASRAATVSLNIVFSGTPKNKSNMPPERVELIEDAETVMRIINKKGLKGFALLLQDSLLKRSVAEKEVEVEDQDSEDLLEDEDDDEESLTFGMSKLRKMFYQGEVIIKAMYFVPNIVRHFSSQFAASLLASRSHANDHPCVVCAHCSSLLSQRRWCNL